MSPNRAMCPRVRLGFLEHSIRPIPRGFLFKYQSPWLGGLPTESIPDSLLTKNSNQIKSSFPCLVPYRQGSLVNQRQRTLLNLDTMRFLCVLFCLFIN
ncbi:hypothetical protein PGT21_025425 [Puccinia graminis f. sp. tritici]|uniref:Uncharacterized protein n=1 Tax=Puccinia graminis f. sp. tritici TaxID=56615 RepID=A0A5B0S371_PUCGR|nr:hypothetical protein PGT21_025425 [Puccinia graminis f. sp. tritici]KAA1132586.1 hypothetical protein PGTUg99_010722 [Puccinia graminis f. sp. tritici]